MAKLVKQIHDLIDIATDKGLTNFYSRPQIDAAIYKAIAEMYRIASKEYPKTSMSRAYMIALQRSSTIALTAGIGNLPSDFSHEVHFFVISSGQNIPIKERGYFDTAKRDPVDPPSVAKPIGTIYADATGVKKIEVYPITAVTPIGILYFKVPTMPSYATDIVLGQTVYDDTASVDVEFPVILHDLITEKTLNVLGLGLQNGQAIRVSDTSHMKDQKI